ncbi:MAG: G-rich domain on putative tyrosine kinase, partial [Pseudomonadota bacterium]
KVLDKAKASKLPVKPKSKVNLIAGFFIGLLLGMGHVLARTFRDLKLFK